MNSRILPIAVCAAFLITGFVIYFHESISQRVGVWHSWEDVDEISKFQIKFNSSDNSFQLDTLDIETLRFLLHGLLTSVEYDCEHVQRFGHDGYGGYDICMSNVSVIKPNSCLIYSFGIDNDWSFDEAISSFFNCTGHAFDPSIGLQDHKHSARIYFHNLGLAGKVSVNKQGWKLSNLGAIKQNLGHAKDAIDVLKVDAEGAEWPLFMELANYDLKVKQLIVEIHTPTKKKAPMTKANYINIIHLMRKLRNSGFLLFNNYHRLTCCSGFAPLLPKELNDTCCHELSYVNINYFRE